MSVILLAAFLATICSKALKFDGEFAAARKIFRFRAEV